MICAGVDIGSTTIKAAVLRGDEVLARAVRPAGPLPAQTAREALDSALAEAGLSGAQPDMIATTGYGRRLADFGDIVLTEIKACATGVRFMAAEARAIRTILDVGGQDTKALSLDEAGEIADFGMNDKCAAGTGRYLEMLAQKLQMSYADFVAAAIEAADSPLQMNATCAVFAETEVVSLIARGERKADVAAAAHRAIAGRIAAMLRRIGLLPDICFVGGGALNRALVRALEEELASSFYIPEHAQSVVALGAAVCARNRLAGEKT